MGEDYTYDWVNDNETVVERDLTVLYMRYSGLANTQIRTHGTEESSLKLDISISPGTTLTEPEMAEDGDSCYFGNSPSLGSYSCSGRTYIGSPTECRRCEVSLLAALSSDRLSQETMHMFHGFKDSVFVICQRLLHFAQGGYDISGEELKTHEKTVGDIANHFAEFRRKINQQRVIAKDMPSRMIFTVAPSKDNVFMVWRLRSQAFEKTLTLPLAEEDHLLEAFQFYFNTCLHQPLTKLVLLNRRPIASLLSSLERLTYAIIDCNGDCSDLRLEVAKLQQTYIDPLTMKIKDSPEIQQQRREMVEVIRNAEQASPPRDTVAQMARRQALSALSSNVRPPGLKRNATSRRLRKEQTL